jgi:hypothetical protein
MNAAWKLGKKIKDRVDAPKKKKRKLSGRSANSTSMDDSCQLRRWAGFNKGRLLNMRRLLKSRPVRN